LTPQTCHSAAVSGGRARDDQLDAVEPDLVEDAAKRDRPRRAMAQACAEAGAALPAPARAVAADAHGGVVDAPLDPRRVAEPDQHL